MLTLTTQLKRVRAAASNLRHTPTKMQRYRTSSWILLIHSITNSTLAVPVTVRDIHGVRINVVDAAKDRVLVAVLQKRMDPDQGQASGLTSDASDERAWRPVFETETGPGPGIRTRTGFGSGSGGRNGTTSDSETETEESEPEPGLDNSDNSDSDGGDSEVPDSGKRSSSRTEQNEPPDIEDQGRERRTTSRALRITQRMTKIFCPARSCSILARAPCTKISGASY